ncbi:protein involved in sex pheromone biosynthesis [Geomicrobium halophilum]|uniref:Protein involved in sex pheromone biosynthesis n=1 Tax=Geomicrobium halophilum TaxID=549000 RepID=A0A841PPN9_9BACL|nr:CamS family sex pheromone protein [Geomicrobium halophilum]MBB6450797.1 protein involved in sex pheromone biosynthesis [Geomicrobium halophilum]
MKQKVTIASIMGMLFMLAGCMQFLEPDTADEAVDGEVGHEETAVDVGSSIPSLSEHYRHVFPEGQYEYGEARGYSSGAVHNRLDLDRLEVGLTEISSETFNPEDYFFQEGQFISREELHEWLARYEEPEEEDDEEEQQPPLGLNPPLGEGDSFEAQERSNPRVLSHINEQNYYTENDEGDLYLSGVSIGLSLNSVYYFREQNEDGTYEAWREEAIPEEEALEAGQEIADEVVSRLRAEEREEGMLNDVPIVVALFREAPRNSTTTGEFIATATAEAENELGSWEMLDEEYYFFPSDHASDRVPGDADRFDQFNSELNSYFSDHIGVTAQGYYQNSELQSLTIEVPIRFQSKMETIAITQQVTSEMEEHFQTDIDISVSVTSNDQPEALITRDAGEKASVHIYD